MNAVPVLTNCTEQWDEFQATDDAPNVLLAKFNRENGEALWVHELRPMDALRLASELAQSALTIMPRAVEALSDTAIEEIKSYLNLMLRSPPRPNNGRSPCHCCGAPRGAHHASACTYVVPTRSADHDEN